MLIHKLLSISLVAVYMVVSPPVNAAPEPSKKTAQVTSKLYVTALEAWDMMQKDSKAILIDVRDPIEIMFTGFSDETDIHVPYLLSDRSLKHAKKPVYSMEKNKFFVEQLEAKLTKLKATKDTILIFMCRSGSTRSAPAANALFNRGWSKSYTMVDGFEGSKNKEGKSKGVRDVNGWRNSGLPWDYKLNFKKMYLTED